MERVNYMKISLNGKDYKIKFGYKPTLKERIISRVIKYANIIDADGNQDMEKVEDLLLFVPEFLLVGLQVNHKDFRYNYDTKEGKNEQLEKVYKIVDDYLNEDDADILQLFNSLQEALMEDSFLSSLFKREQEKIANAENAV